MLYADHQAEAAASADHYGDVILSAHLITDRRCHHTILHISLPQAFTRIGAIGIKIAVDATLEYQVSGSGQHATVGSVGVVRSPCRLLLYRIPGH